VKQSEKPSLQVRAIQREFIEAWEDANYPLAIRIHEANLDLNLLKLVDKTKCWCNRKG